MRLHENIPVFRQVIDRISSISGLRKDVIEKDYYVVLMLRELAGKQDKLPAFFKGGTALYKALKATNRFSEDIDLSVDVRHCSSRTQCDKYLDLAAKKYSSLKRIEGQGFSHRSEVVTFFGYNPIVDVDVNDELQRFGKLKIEATSFTISEPVELLEIAPLVYDYSNSEEQKFLEKEFDVIPFKIQTITMERIFIDKLFAAESYVRRADQDNRAFEAAKHIYDLAVIWNHPRIQTFLQNEIEMKLLLDIRVEEEKNRKDGIPGMMPKDFNFFFTAARNPDVRKKYAIMQNQYVLLKNDRIDFDVAMEVLLKLQTELMNNRAWRLYDAGVASEQDPNNH